MHLLWHHGFKKQVFNFVSTQIKTMYYHPKLKTDINEYLNSKVKVSVRINGQLRPLAHPNKYVVLTNKNGEISYCMRFNG